MAPVKFDDIAKTANEVLNDDYQTSGYQFNAKQKTSWDGAVISTAVDLFPGKEGCMTPAKLTWKFPTPLGVSAFAIDKLEMDKTGGMKLEMSSDKAYKGLKLECKSDLKSTAKIVGACTYTGIADLFLKMETKATKPQDFVLDISKAQGPATVAMKLTPSNMTSPDVGLRVLSGPVFASFAAKEAFSTFVASCHYKATSELRCAASYTYGGKANGNFTVGVAFEPKKGTLLKAKVQQDQSVSCSVKHGLTKGFTLLGGLKYDTVKGMPSCGFKLNVE
mmetsp:Transcript_90069/g.160387  ORF Transcript_90069/g.160387 Transcript_90069/m.160387 type:complete len:277 (-) Transcript_90069:179-1009(-)|eukprot:CAMPEP_0197654226 /NCGR_PEP_ID=MMETSP1338-20131121/38722_1 /TAXON_ID=43686 ORGANISM="Pelagodinium beii, Strain RCC1491" /NCGR_SAMPLE_ID=MMETSP1338 /ASSEMBLY_ACC=CAM_ASM_000754 /LENGTH=276 /DNA_ID=CAMNT_0043229629 /DNA_START=79 /DNA_END=909 /DNA_ORIENTATION=+